MRPRTKNQLASGGTVGGVLDFKLEASEACSAEETQYQLLFLDIVSPLAVLFRVRCLTHSPTKSTLPDTVHIRHREKINLNL